jgi:hypothetical protein
VLEEGEGLAGGGADVGGEPGGLLAGEDPPAKLAEQGPLDAHEGVGGHPGSDVVGSGAGLVGQQVGQGAGGPGDGQLLAGLQGRAGGDQAVDRPQPVQGGGVPGFGLAEPAAAVEQEPPEGGQRRLAGRPSPDGLDQLVPEGLEPGVEEVFLGGK